VILSLVSSVAGNYMQLLGLDQQLVIAKRTMETYGESVRIFELQFKYGQVSEMTVQQARTQYETAAAAIPQIELEIVQIENALSVLLGRNPGPIPRGKTLEQLAVPAVPSGLPSDLLLNRPDILQAEPGSDCGQRLHRGCKALYFPTISLTGGLGLASSALSDLFKGNSREWSYSGRSPDRSSPAGRSADRSSRQSGAESSAPQYETDHPERVSRMWRMF